MKADHPHVSCRQLDPLVTPYVDGELQTPDRDAVEAHLQRCPPCHSRVSAEKAVKHLLRAQKTVLGAVAAPQALRLRCAKAAQDAAAASNARFAGATNPARHLEGTVWWQRAVPFALAASLVLVVSGAFIYQATEHSPALLAAELTADHVKCFAVNTVLDPTRDVARIEQSLVAQFGWSLRLPEVSERTGLELVGERPCLYGEGRVAHIMYRYHGDPVSLFLLPRAANSKEIVDVMGHKAAIWSDGQHTFVLIAREKPSEVARMAAIVRAGIQ